MKVYGLIPARSGSQGVPNKNIKLLNGYPLIAYSIIASGMCEFIDKTIVTTDSQEYKKIATEYSSDVIMRPSYMARDDSPDIDYLLHFIFVYKLQPEDLIVLLRPTTPLRNVDIMGAIFNEFEIVYDSLRTVHKLNEPPEKMMHLEEVKKGDRARLFPYMDIKHEVANQPRHHFRDCYQPNGYMDILQVSSILTHKKTYNKYVLGYRTDKVVEIDSMDDFDYLEYQINKNDNALYTYIKEHYEPAGDN